MYQRLRLIDEDFRVGREPPRAPPSRFHINLGERCNLACVHCITDAPAKTREQRAQVMSDAVLDALLPSLQGASYLGLTHAGEPMVQPGFARLLAHVGAHAPGERPVLHVLTNGAALDEARFVELARAGVSSLSFSLDGLRAASNDVVRVGARVERVLTKLRAFAALRREHRLDVRLGISWVCTALNLEELPALVAFAGDAGLDWIKLEELFVVHERAAHLAVPAADLRRALAPVVAAASARGIAVVDHTESVPVWKCQLQTQKKMARFSAADDLANRTDINPCRLPWEQVCVEPNGDVRPLSFHHPVAGNLLVEPLASLWARGPFVEARAQAMRTRLCGAGPATCARDPGPRAW